MTCDPNEYAKFKEFYLIFSNYFKYWYCPTCEIQEERVISLEIPFCRCGKQMIPWIVAAASAAKREAKEYEEKYNSIILDKERMMLKFKKIDRVCKKYGFVETEGTIEQFLEEKLNAYEGLLDALPSELRAKLEKKGEKYDKITNGSDYDSSLSDNSS
jgi:hypothetical protein